MWSDNLLKCTFQSSAIAICADLFGGFDEPLRLLWIVRLWFWFAGHFAIISPLKVRTNFLLA